MFTNPTGGGVRNDPIGEGYWHAPRGNRLHLGVDFLLPEGPGQPIVAPHEGIVVRYSFPYASDPQYSGLYIKGHSVESYLWYLMPSAHLIGRQVAQGRIIGYAQDISKKYGVDCRPHVHWQIGKYGEIDPLILI
jgi:murein DD-endopeptidase MepM/ murein hydrolase activator NlpD